MAQLKKKYPADAQTGVLKFLRVKKAYLTIQKNVSNTPIKYLKA